MCQFVLFSASSFCHKTHALLRYAAIFLTLLLFLMGKGFSAVQDITRKTLPNQNYTETIRGSDMGGGVGGVLYTLVSGQRQFNSYNSRGDVVNTSNDSGNSTWQGAYEALGTRTAENGSNPSRQRANTKDEDPTGLLNEGFRYRDLETGLFITRDPLGFVDGPNVYTYVRQNPWTFFDPLGLNEVIVSGGINANKGGWDIQGPSKTGVELPAKIMRKFGAPVAHDRNWKNFISSAQKAIQDRKAITQETIEWHVEVMSYVERAKSEGLDPMTYVKEIRGIAKEEGVDLRFYGTKEGLIRGLITAPDSTSARKENEKVSRLMYFGHGAPNELMLHYRNVAANGKGEKFESSDIGSLEKQAFTADSKFISYGCNTATCDSAGNSFTKSWKEKFKGHDVYGVEGRTSYFDPEKVVPAESESAKWVPSNPDE
jgi:RHS repeat-associated protein